MPSEIGWSFHGLRRGGFETAFPGETVRMQMYEPDEDAYHILLILCDTEDYATRVFQFERTDEATLDTPIEELALHCTPDALLAQMPHQDEHVINTQSQPGVDMQVFIGHQSLLCFRDYVHVHP